MDFDPVYRHVFDFVSDPGFLLVRVKETKKLRDQVALYWVIVYLWLNDEANGDHSFGCHNNY